MTPDQVLGLSCFLAGIAAGCLVQCVCLQADRRAKLRDRFRAPPFTTIGAGRRE